MRPWGPFVLLGAIASVAAELCHECDNSHVCNVCLNVATSCDYVADCTSSGVESLSTGQRCRVPGFLGSPACGVTSANQNCGRFFWRFKVYEKVDCDLASPPPLPPVEPWPNLPPSPPPTTPPTPPTPPPP
eukprot:scaffold35073_cov163-Isochrysis_galbana.AAC.1